MKWTANTGKYAVFPELRGVIANQVPGFCEIKLDGELENIIVSQDSVVMVNKNGFMRSEWNKLDEFKAVLASHDIQNGTFLAELYYGDGKFGDFYEFLRHKCSEDLNFTVFDVGALNQQLWTSVPYIDRREALLDICPGHINKPIYVETVNECLDFMKVATDWGYEGIVVKKADSLLRFGPSPWAKLKKTDCTYYTVSYIDPTAERIEVLVPNPINPIHLKPCGVKCPQKIKDRLQISDQVPITHNGVLKTGGLRHPYINETNLKIKHWSDKQNIPNQERAHGIQ